MSAIKGLFGADAEEFSTALKASFSNDRLKEMLFYKLKKDIEDYSGSNRPAKILAIIIEANQRNYWRELVLAALESNPTSPPLIDFAGRIGLTSEGTSLGPELQARVRAINPLLDPDVFRATMAATEFRVCRVQYPVPGALRSGTGFLVNDDVLMTNYHVVAPVIDKQAKPEEVVLLFDYRRSIDGKTVSPGTRFGLETDWLIDSSPYDPKDLKPDPEVADRPADHLDYALLRVKGKPGTRPIGTVPDPNGVPRGHVSVPEVPYTFARGGPLMILQHPDDEALGKTNGVLKLSIESDAILGTNPNGTRVRYRSNTYSGSSGSPCLDFEGRLVALHHAGDPNSDLGANGLYNQGIPVAAIRRLMKERGTDGCLGA